jgi:hypothetical protein
MIDVLDDDGRFAVARVFRRAAFLRDSRKTLASEEASYNTPKSEHLVGAAAWYCFQANETTGMQAMRARWKSNLYCCLLRKMGTE